MVFIKSVQTWVLPITMYQILQETIQTSVLDEETVQQLQLPIDIFFQIKESNQNSVHSKTSCCFEPMVNTKQHSNNEEYYNFDHDENRNQENMKRTDHKGMKNFKQLNVTAIHLLLLFDLYIIGFGSIKLV